ncbi:hypothetical protein [Methylobacterium sp. CM6257]
MDINQASCGLFLTHVKSDRIARHYGRLTDETRCLFPWHLAYNPGRTASLVLDVAYQASEVCMPRRHGAMVSNGGVQNGFMDTAIFPILLSLNADYIWVQEYDVDFSGVWSDFFEQFAGNDADLLTTTLVSKKDVPDWSHWDRAGNPCHLPDDELFRSFLPIMRVSKRLAIAYVEETNRREWSGHYEFLIPTIAIKEGFTVEDIGGVGPRCPPDRLSMNYLNNPYVGNMNPGTFIFRPYLQSYFHEDAGMFEHKNFLYHPIKADVEPWSLESLRQGGLPDS